MRRPLLALAALWVLGCGAGPPREPCQPEPEPGELGSICGFQNPEDMAAPAGMRLLLVSQLARGEVPGGLAGLPLDRHGDPAGEPFPLWPRSDDDPAEARRGDPRCVEPPAPESFSPHGIDVGPPGPGGTVPVAVVHHGSRESLELFDLSGRGGQARLAWRGCVPLPPDTAGNDVAFASAGRLLVTNYQPTYWGVRGFAWTLLGGLGMETGDVMSWAPGEGWRHLEGTGAANPNGVAWRAEGERVFFAETNRGRVHRTGLRGESGEGTEALDVGGRPDNLAWSPRGPLLVLTHLAGVGVLRCRFQDGPCRTPWALLEIEADLSSATELLRHDGARLGAASGAAEVGGRFYIGAVFDDRIGLWKPAE